MYRVGQIIKIAKSCSFVFVFTALGCSAAHVAKSEQLGLKLNIEAASESEGQLCLRLSDQICKSSQTCLGQEHECIPGICEGVTVDAGAAEKCLDALAAIECGQGMPEECLGVIQISKESIEKNNRIERRN